MIHALKKYETAIHATCSLLNEMLVYSSNKGVKQVDKRCRMHTNKCKIKITINLNTDPQLSQFQPVTQ